MKQVYHHYEKLEECTAGMWEIPKGAAKKTFLEKAIRFTGNANEYGRWMMKVIIEWPFSCEHNLTAKSNNRQAWIGHAACCLAIGCPESITREAWGFLSEDQHIKANKKADTAIRKWEQDYQDKKQLPLWG